MHELDQPTTQRHRRFWLDDGDLLLSNRGILYKVHRAPFEHCSSTFLSSLQPSDGIVMEGIKALRIPDNRQVDTEDLEVLIEHVSGDTPIDDSTPFPKVASLLRASSEGQLDFSAVNTLARSHLERLFPTGHDLFARSEYAEEALILSTQYNIPSIRKPLFYTVATHPHEHDAADIAAAHPALSPDLAARCETLLENLVSHFTPVLFTVATAGHMACTDILAEQWMSLVISPALEDNGLTRPLETLERIIGIDWRKEGLCEECVRDKTEEWRGEQETVWEAMDAWVG
ncbi:uncharacterized protein BXZ73DRAFT_57734 [Epithele typhae]|uniref:uncharacterized protein n=1 Tax=Epithele typhae TaxID=378194 RepID=UPI002007CCF3|nr:uncharacterized protein BXZ73DRAFT_57734 [Epithele typhae]KAH9910788.1 hypothetical protein BXZ73DRAFT_57734 [Epithele typhae]